ncbi:BMC domain-containing protein [bacterium]|nr:BMC domain-containing protein [bacterium]
MLRDALGLIETRGLVGALEAADAACKAAEVRIGSISSNDDALVVIRIEGDLGAVQAAIEAGARAARQLGTLINARVFGRPTEELSGLLDSIPGGTGITVLSRTVAESKPKPRVAGPKPKAARPPKPQPTPEPIAEKPPSPAPAPEPTSEPTPPVTAPPAVEPTPSPKPTPPPPVQGEQGMVSIAELEKLPVVKLRRYARTLDNLPIQGRQISMANKQQLLEAIRAISGGA